jgi:hypothetical protein
MIGSNVSYGQLYELLSQLNFVDVSSERRWKAYQLRDGDVLILLANRDPHALARTEDLVSVRRHLVDNGVLDPLAFERLVS